MRNAPGVPDLVEDETALGVDGAYDLFPALDLLGRVDARRARIADGLGRNIGGFGDDQPALAGALAVIGGVHRLGNVAGLAGAQPRERRHDDAMRERDRAEREGLEESVVRHVEIPLLFRMLDASRP